MNIQNATIWVIVLSSSPFFPTESLSVPTGELADPRGECSADLQNCESASRIQDRGYAGGAHGLLSTQHDPIVLCELLYL